MFDDQTEPQLVPKLLLQVSVRELHNILVSDPNDSGLKYARDEENNILISDSTLRSLLPPQLNQMSARYKLMYGCECCIYDKIINSSLLSWRDRYLKKIKYQSQNAQNRRSVEKSYHIYETHKNKVMPHGRHIYSKAADMEQSTLCIYLQSDNALTHWKCLLWCCYECPCINLPDQETDHHNSDTTPSIRFHVYHIIARCTPHGRIPLKDKKMCYICKQESSPDKSTKIYTIKELVMMETTTSVFHTCFYIPATQKLAFHLPHVRIIGTNHCGEM